MGTLHSEHHFNTVRVYRLEMLKCIPNVQRRVKHTAQDHRMRQKWTELTVAQCHQT